MARSQAELHELLVSILPEETHIYFQPPPNVEMEYPCLRYEKDSAVTSFAGNAPYRFLQRYKLTWMDLEPDSPIPTMLAETLPMCTWNRWYPKDELNHDALNLFY